MKFETIQDFPTGIAMTDCTLRASHAVGIQMNLFNFKREAQVFPGVRWELEVTFAALKRPDADRLEAWMLSLRGQAGKFRFGDPWRSLPKGAARGVPTVAQSTAAGTEVLAISGWVANVPNILLAGDYVEIKGRLYRALSDSHSGGAGTSSVVIFPPLRDSVVAGEAIKTRNALGIFALTSNAPEFSRSRFDLMSCQLSAAEIL